MLNVYLLLYIIIWIIWFNMKEGLIRVIHLVIGLHCLSCMFLIQSKRLSQEAFDLETGHIGFALYSSYFLTTTESVIHSIGRHWLRCMFLIL